MGSRECYLSLQSVMSSAVSAKWRWKQGDGSGLQHMLHADNAMQISSPGPAAGRLRPTLHLRGDESRGLLGMSSDRWTEPELAAIRSLEIIINLTGCGTRTPSVWGSVLKCLPGMATADFYADMFRLNQPNIFRAEVVTFGWLEVAGAGEVPATIRAEVRCWCSENNKIINR